MTLLTIIQAAADELSLVRPSSVIGNSDDEVIKLLRYSNKCGIALMRAFPWQVLRNEETFTGISGETQTGILPDGFDRIVPETFWNRSTPVLISGPVNPVQWQGLKATSYTGNPKFAYRGGAILVYPALAGGETLAFEWISENWCQSSGGTGQASWVADTDTGRLSEELLTLGTVYEYLAGENLPWETAYRSYKTMMADLTRNERATAGVLAAGDIFGTSSSRHFTGAPTSNVLAPLS